MNSAVKVGNDNQLTKKSSSSTHANWIQALLCQFYVIMVIASNNNNDRKENLRREVFAGFWRWCEAIVQEILLFRWPQVSTSSKSIWVSNSFLITTVIKQEKESRRWPFKDANETREAQTSHRLRALLERSTSLSFEFCFVRHRLTLLQVFNQTIVTTFDQLVERRWWTWSAKLQLTA